MTEISVARPTRPLHRHLAGATPLAIALAYGGGGWLQFLHAREGGIERNEPGLVAHWLRDGTLALPLVLLAVAVAFVLVQRVLRRFEASPAPRSRAASPRRPARSPPPTSSASATRSTRCCSTRSTAATTCRCRCTCCATARSPSRPAC